MIIPDVNLLVYAYDEASPFHPKAGKWWASCLAGSRVVGIPWAVALGFVRLTTNPRVFADPLSVDEATAHVESWLDRQVVRIVHPGPRHAALVFGFLRENGAGGNLTTDAHIAALAIASRAVVHTTDTDFLRFSGVEWVNPLV